MARLEFDGWVTGKWEEIDEATMKRRRRRYYSLTAKGKQRTDEALRALDIKILDC
jgi:DNA-binding PadR family transcriptional regulator